VTNDQKLPAPSADRPIETTYFGLWSAKKIRQVSELLRALSVRHEAQEEKADQNILEAWCAWDATAENPHIGFGLWIWTADLLKVGLKIVEAFPERKFGAP
jgi:hypothetical protein